jgi:hypothetical protein
LIAKGEDESINLRHGESNGDMAVAHRLCGRVIKPAQIFHIPENGVQID